MKYNIYLKELGMSRRAFRHLKRGDTRPSQLKDKIKYGVAPHEMQLLDVHLACEIYPRLRYLHEQANLCYQFLDEPLLQTPATDEDTAKKDAYEQAQWRKVLHAFEMIIKMYLDVSMETGWSKEEYNEQIDKIQEGLQIFAKHFFNIGI